MLLEEWSEESKLHRRGYNTRRKGEIGDLNNGRKENGGKKLYKGSWDRVKTRGQERRDITNSTETGVNILKLDEQVR